jgi:hypothetical protein
MRVLYVLRDQIFKFKSRRFNILCHYCNIYNTKKFFIRIVKIVLIYNSQNKISYIVRQFQILKFVHIKNESFKNLHISSLYKLRSCKDRFLMRNTCICVYIILIFKLNVNFFLYTYTRNTFSSKRSENIAFNKIKCSCYCLLK